MKPGAAAYVLGYIECKRLRALAGPDARPVVVAGEYAAELAAIDRLEDFEGTAADVETAARIFERGGEPDRAASLRRWVKS